MRKLWKTLFILVVLAGASAGLYAWTRNGKKGDGGFKLQRIHRIGPPVHIHKHRAGAA